MIENSLKRKLEAGEVTIGPFVNCSYPAFTEILGLAGFDFCILDMEHGPLHTLVLEDLVRAAQGVGLAPIVRVRKNDGPQIQRALDIGSAGVQVPQIETAEEAQSVVQGAKYNPIGKRGLSYYLRAADYGAGGVEGVLDTINKEQLVIVHVEGIQGIENLDSVVSVPNIDVIFLGPYDLSQSLGIPGMVSDPRVTKLMETASSKIRAAGKFVGTFADNPETAKRWSGLGVQYIALGVDVQIFLHACQEIVDEVRN